MSDVREVNIAPVSEVAPEAVVETPVVETPVASEEAPQAETDNMAARFAALARKEKEVRESQEQAKSELAKYQEYQDLQEKAKTNPMSVLEKYGIDLDSVITASLGGEEEVPKTVEEQILALREEIANEKKSVEEKAKASEEAKEKALQDSIDGAVLKHKESITAHLDDNKEKYELINLHGGQDLVWEVTEQWYDENNGEILTPDVAADKVEAYYEEQVRKAMQLTRFKTKTPEAPSGTFETTTTRQDSPTLTSDQSAPAGSKTTHLNVEESKKAAAALLQWD